MVSETINKSQYQGFSIKKDFAKMIQKHIDGDPRFNNMVSFVKFAVLNQIERDNKVNGNTNRYQLPSGEESKSQGGNEYEQMDTTKGHNAQMDSVRLSADQGKQGFADESWVEDPKGKVGSMGGEDVSCL